MRPPFIEARTLLAAHGHRLAPIDPRPFTIRSIPMTARFALLPRVDAVTLPVVFDDLDALARSIERRRQGQPIELVDVEEFDRPGDAHTRRVVQVWTLDLGNARDRMIGFAWLEDRGEEALKPALRRARAAAQADRPPADRRAA